MSEFTTIARTSEIPPGMAKVCTLQGREIAVIHADGSFRAVDNTCPHAGGSLGEGTVIGDKLECPFHCWQFDTKTGACCTVPGITIKAFDVLVENDEIKVKIS